MQPEVIFMQKNCTKLNGTFFNETCYTEEMHGADLYSEIVTLVGNATPIIKSPSDEYFQ